MARAPKISAGIASGSTSSDSSMLPRRSPSVSAAPMAPSALSMPVPSASDRTTVPRAAAGTPRLMASKGETSTSGNPQAVQCAAPFASASSASGCPDSSSCSRVPSAWSERNRNSMPSSAASSAATHSTPPASCRSSPSSGLSASGNSVVTIAKNTTGWAMWSQCLKASTRSRRNIRSIALPGVLRGISRAPRGGRDGPGWRAPGARR